VAVRSSGDDGAVASVLEGAAGAGVIVGRPRGARRDLDEMVARSPRGGTSTNSTGIDLLDQDLDRLEGPRVGSSRTSYHRPSSRPFSRISPPRRRSAGATHPRALDRRSSGRQGPVLGRREQLLPWAPSGTQESPAAALAVHRSPALRASANRTGRRPKNRPRFPGKRAVLSAIIDRRAKPERPPPPGAAQPRPRFLHSTSRRSWSRSPPALESPKSGCCAAAGRFSVGAAGPLRPLPPSPPPRLRRVPRRRRGKLTESSLSRRSARRREDPGRRGGDRVPRNTLARFVAREFPARRVRVRRLGDHAALLRQSAISPKVARARGYRSIGPADSKDMWRKGTEGTTARARPADPRLACHRRGRLYQTGPTCRSVDGAGNGPAPPPELLAHWPTALREPSNTVPVLDVSPVAREWALDSKRRST